MDKRLKLAGLLSVFLTVALSPATVFADTVNVGSAPGSSISFSGSGRGSLDRCRMDFFFGGSRSGVRLNKEAR